MNPTEETIFFFVENFYRQDFKTLLLYPCFKSAENSKDLDIKDNYIFIPNSVSSIGDSAFYNCRSLEEIVIPNSVVSIGDDAFPEWTKVIRNN